MTRAAAPTPTPYQRRNRQKASHLTLRVRLPGGFRRLSSALTHVAQHIDTLVRPRTGAEKGVDGVGRIKCTLARLYPSGTENRTRPPGPSSMLIVPPWASTIPLAIAKPRPEPPDSRLRESSARTNRSKARSLR